MAVFVSCSGIITPTALVDFVETFCLFVRFFKTNLNNNSRVASKLVKASEEHNILRPQTRRVPYVDRDDIFFFIAILNNSLVASNLLL